jgi:hypothetical protein
MATRRVSVRLNGIVLGEHEIELNNLNATAPGIADYVMEAKENCIEDGILSREQADEAEFVVIK